ncbi:acyl-CoA dehydrogenase family protein [Streptomyces sp. NPDC014344]|uniref:acyl-CoA dehydrogenase family protein n=1 Tax=Streptomyces sp. NPDC014344 TaxID=3364871 RepID=UPI00370113A5
MNAVLREFPGVAAAEELERLLGDPYDDAGPYGFAAAVARDERDAFPEELCAVLREAGFHLNYLPKEWGGGFESFDRSMLLVRAAARRDLNVMPGTMFGITAATCLALHGSPEQQRYAADLLRRGGAVGFALSEADHGSDLLANTARLEPAADGWRLTGEKWMVGLGRRCEAVYLVARTGERGPGAFSAVLLDLTGGPDGFERSMPVRTGGMRGIDFAHLRFDGFPVPAAALVGRAGQGLEVAVKAQQVVRTMSMAGSLGCGDTALRLSLDFAAGRRTGRSMLTETPYVRRELAVASAALLAADVTALAAARGIHAAPELFSVWGCAAKHAVAEATEELMRRCATVLATRSVLRTEGPGGGLFQKLQRDAALVRVVDASTVANLRSFASQLPAVAGARATDEAAEFVRTVFDLRAPLPPYEPGRLDLNARGRDPVTAALPTVVREASARLAADPGTAALVDRLGAAVAGLADEAARADRDTGQVDLAERFSWLHAACCCLHLWWANRELPLWGTDAGSSGWLGACLGFLLARAEGADPRRAAAAQLAAWDAVRELHRRNRLFSALPVRLAPASAPSPRP